MQYFEDAEGKLVFRENGEVVQVEAWGEDSVRVRSRFLGDILEETCGGTDRGTCREAGSCGNRR